MKRTVKACQAALEDIGFRRRLGRLVIDLNDDVVGGCGLGRATVRPRTMVRISPVVAAAHVPLEAEVARIRGVPAPRRYEAKSVISRPLGYLMPKKTYTTWHFAEGDDIDGLALDLAKAVSTYGFPFMHEHLRLEDFYESMVTRRYGGLNQAFAYRLPVAAMMLGKPDAARVHIAEYLVKLEEESGFRPAERLPMRREVGIAFRLARPARTKVDTEYRECAARVLCALPPRRHGGRRRLARKPGPVGPLPLERAGRHPGPHLVRDVELGAVHPARRGGLRRPERLPGHLPPRRK